MMDVKPLSGVTWRPELSGLIADKRPWTHGSSRPLRRP
jgi:hypothetical protein